MPTPHIPPPAVSHRRRRATAGRARFWGLGPAWAVAACGAAIAPPLHAQAPVPDAGQVLREQPRPAAPRGGDAAVQIPPEVEAGPQTSGLRFEVKSLRIEGADALGEGKAEALLADVPGPQVSVADLHRAAARLTAALRAQGHLVARAYVPTQAVTDGVVVIRVLEGRLSGVDLDNRSALRDATLQRVLDAQPLVGAAVHRRTIDRALLLTADLPGVGPVEGVLRPGREVGSSELRAIASPGRAYEAEVTLDNHGNRYTGPIRLGASFDWLSPSGRGERLALRGLVTDRGLLFGRVAADAPLHGDGLRGGIALSRSSYTLAREYAALKASGRADTVGLNASWPAWRGVFHNLWLEAAIERRALADDVQAAATHGRRRASVASIELRGEHLDGGAPSAAAAMARTNWRVAASHGQLRISSAAEALADATGPQAAGRFTKLQLAVSRLQPLNPDAALYLSASAQAASKNLDSSERFVLGGMAAVRAYALGEAGGDDGWLGSIEWRQRLASQWQAAAFYDAGRVRHAHRMWSSTGPVYTTLQGAGLWLATTQSHGTMRLTLAKRLSAAAVSVPDQRWRIGLSLGTGF